MKGKETRLLFDLRATQPNGSGKRHGGGRYGEVIFFRMAEMGLKFGCFYDSGLWFNPDVKKVVEEKGLPLHDVAGKKVQEIIDTEGYDRIYSCLHSLETLTVKGCKIYGTIHGLRQFETPWDSCFWMYKNTTREKIKFILKYNLPGLWRKREEWKWRRKFVNGSKELNMVVVSEHTKYAVKSFFPEVKDWDMQVFFSPNTSLKTENLELRTLRVSESRANSFELCRAGAGSTKSTKNDGGERYFLAVSGNRWEKNNLRAIEAFDRLLSAGLIKDVRMKVTGAKTASIYKYKLQNPEAFDFLGYVSEEELEQLYAGAYLFVYPSLNEGFGYPPIEAMRYKVPVIASPLSSMAEILDQGALYFNPFLVEEIMNRMLMMMEPERHREFSERGYRQYLKISERQRRDLDGVIEYIIN